MLFGSGNGLAYGISANNLAHNSAKCRGGLPEEIAWKLNALGKP